MEAFSKAGVPTSLVKMWLSSGESSPRFLGCPDLSASIVVGQAENDSLGCSHAKAVMWVHTGTWDTIVGMESGSYGICVRRVMERWSQAWAGARAGDLRSRRDSEDWMSLYTFTADQTCKQQEKAKPSTEEPGGEPLPKAVSLLCPLLTKHCITLTVKEKCLSVQCIITNQELKSNTWVSAPSRRTLFLTQNVGEDTRSGSVCCGMSLLVYLSLKVCPLRTLAFYRGSCPPPPPGALRTAFLFPRGVTPKRLGNWYQCYLIQLSNCSVSVSPTTFRLCSLFVITTWNFPVWLWTQLCTKTEAYVTPNILGGLRGKGSAWITLAA